MLQMWTIYSAKRNMKTATVNDMFVDEQPQNGGMFLVSAIATVLNSDTGSTGRTNFLAPFPKTT